MRDPDNAARITALFRHDKHERWRALSEIEHHLNNDEFWSAFISVWTLTESNGRFMSLIQNMIQVRLTSPKDSSWLGMSREQKKFLTSLPQKVEVFRGCGIENPFTSWSFTTSEETAKWFSDHRVLNDTACVLRAHVNKKHILFADEREQEVVVNPEHLMSVRYTKRPERSIKEKSQAAFFMEVQNGLFADDESLLQMDLVRLSGFKMSVDEYVGKLISHAEELEELGFSEKPAAIRNRMATLQERLSDENSKEYAYVFPVA